MSRYQGTNVLEKIGAFVPGYAGYAEREGRRQADKLLRAALAKDMQTKKKLIDGTIQRFTGEGKLASVSQLDALRRQLDLTANRLSYANCGASGFFDAVQINEQDLDRVYAYDLSMVAAVEACMQKVDAMTKAADADRLCPEIHEGLRQLEDLIDKRNKVLMEV